jgi:hypothetical protein
MTVVSPRGTSREKTEFKFLGHIPIDIDHTLFQLLRAFQSVRDGLPELPKNSKDHYSRRGVVAKHDRQIVILADSEDRSVAVLDFAGAKRADFTRWMEWSSAKASAAESSGDIEGGHGNGGKAFMVAGSETNSSMESCTDGRCTKMGYKNDDETKRHRPAFIVERGVPLDDVPETTSQARLEKALRRMGASFKTLPADAQRVFTERRYYTLVEVNGVKEWIKRRAKTLKETLRELPAMLAQHPQMGLTVESCDVWVIVDGKLVTPKPLSPIYPSPMPKFEDISPIAVPEKLIDPATGEQISTGAKGLDKDFLQLRTSKRHLRIADKMLNVIRVRNSRNVVANLSVAELAPQNESAFIFGEVRLASLTPEHLSGSERKGLAETPLSRALLQWLAEQVAELAARIQKVIAKDHKQQDRDKANESLTQLRDLMKRFLEPEVISGENDLAEEGTKGKGNNGGNPGGEPRERGERVDAIELETGRTTLALAAGTSIPLIIRCVERTKTGEEVPVFGAALELCTSETAPLSLDPARTLHADATWRGQIWVRDKASGVESNKLEVESISCSGADVLGVDRLLLQGERVHVKVGFHTPDGPREDLLLEGWVDETDRGRLSRGGVFTAAREEGPVTLRVRFGPKAGDVAAYKMHIGQDALPPRQRGGGEGGGNIPYILLCSTEAPGMGDLPVAQRTHHGGEHYPTIIEEPPFEDVVWINPDSKESSRVRLGRGGTKGSAGIGTKTFTQFVALKCFDILKRLKVRQELHGTAVTEIQFRDRFAMAEIACADFIDEAYEIAGKLAADSEKDA